MKVTIQFIQLIQLRLQSQLILWKNNKFLTKTFFLQFSFGYYLFLLQIGFLVNILNKSTFVIW